MDCRRGPGAALGSGSVAAPVFRARLDATTGARRRSISTSAASRFSSARSAADQPPPQSDPARRSPARACASSQANANVALSIQPKAGVATDALRKRADELPRAARCATARRGAGPCRRWRARRHWPRRVTVPGARDARAATPCSPARSPAPPGARQGPGSTARISNRFSSSCRESSVTCAPRCGRMRTRPRLSSRRNASRMLARLTPNALARSTSFSRCPGANCSSTMAAPIRSAICSGSVGVSKAGVNGVAAGKASPRSRTTVA